MVVTTTGDRAPTSPIHAIGGTGVFVKEVQEAVLDGRADVAVHSAKDLPAVDARRPRARRGARARPTRATRSSASTLDDLPDRRRASATGSVRRRAQLAARCAPTSRSRELRGNIETRLEKRASGFDAVVVAAAALDRLGLADAGDRACSTRR